MLCGLICTIRAHLNLHGVTLFAHDVFVPLDGAWRMLWGQKPHVDFYTPFGIGTYLPTLAGMMFSKTISAFAIGQAITAMLLTVWVAAIGYRRLDPLPLALLILLVALTTAGISNMGFATFSFTPAMTYNRHCYALTMILLLEALVPRLKPGGSDTAGGFSTGVALCLVLLTKITFFLGCAALLVLLIPCRKQTRGRLLGILAGFALGTLAFAAYSHFDLRPMVSDIATAGKAKRLLFRFYLLDNIFLNASLCLALGVGTWVVTKNWRPAYAAGMVAAMGTAFVVTCFEPSGFPLLAFIGILSLAQLQSSRDKFAMFLAIVALIPATIDVFAYGAGLAGASMRKTQKVFHCEALESARLRGFEICDIEIGYTKLVNDGVQLAEAHSKKGDAIMSLDFTNPFPFALNIAPMHGGVTNLQEGGTFSEHARSSPEWTFGTATLVLLPKFFSDPSLYNSVEQIYGPYLHTNFVKVDESATWTIYRRHESAQQPVGATTLNP